MTRILAVDPGSSDSGWLILDAGHPSAFGIVPNLELLAMLRGGAPADIAVIEQIESYGMAVGREVFETVWWAGRFAEAAEQAGLPTARMPRRSVKLAICGDSRARDSNIRVALLDRYGGTAAVGRKAEPGPLYGISRDVWSALAIAVTYAEGATA